MDCNHHYARGSEDEPYECLLCGYTTWSTLRALHGSLVVELGLGHNPPTPHGAAYREAVWEGNPEACSFACQPR